MEHLMESELNVWTAIFCCGNASNGELGLRGIEDDHVVELTAVPQFPHSDSVQDIASGLNHTIVLLKEGQVFTCGNNDTGQLGRQSSQRRLKQVESLSAHAIHRISCGVRFSAVLSEAGQLFSWGDNSRGQLGLNAEDEIVPIPRIIKDLAAKQVIQVSCGYNHILALTNNGELYSWGDNSFNQLGVGTAAFEKQPQFVTFLKDIPILQIAAGGNHNFVLTVSGALLGWGKNEFGQLGLSDNVDRTRPTPQYTLRSQSITYICCGDNHTAALTKDGGVFTFGAGMYGQLGHGSRNNELLPRKVLELMGNTVTQVACGRCHTVAYVPSKKRLYSFGLGGSGQLCRSVSTTNCFIPVLIALPWTNSPLIVTKSDNALVFDSKNCDIEDNLKNSCEKRKYFDDDSLPSPMEVDEDDSKLSNYPEENLMDSTLSACIGNEKNDDKNCTQISIFKVICGGDHTFVIANCTNLSIENSVESSVDFRKLPQESHILTLNSGVLEEVVNISPEACVSQELMSYIEATFSSSACLNGSFLKKDGTQFYCSVENHGIDISSATMCFHYIKEAKNSSIANLIALCLENLFANLQPIPIFEGLRLYFILPLCHLFQDAEKNLASVIYPFAKAFLQLPEEMVYIVGTWWVKLGALHFKNIVTIFKDSVIYILTIIEIEKEQTSGIKDAHKEILKQHLWASLNMLRALQNINITSNELLPYQDFHIPEVTEKVDIMKEYISWLQEPDGMVPQSLFFCDYPFVFDSKAKSLILQADSMIRMRCAMDSAYRQTLTSAFLPLVPPSPPFLVLEVARENIALNALKQLSVQQESDLAKPMKVIFEGEDAVDAGGVKKEFFLLLIKEILDPKYGMFIEYPETRCIWFRSQTFEEDKLFYLIGIVCGLAIYNSIIIDLPFPLALYKKLLAEEIKLEDLKGLSPSIVQSLHSLLQHEEDDVEEVFLLAFEISVDVFGDNVSFELKPGGKEIPVTKENKEEYVNLYVDFILNKSVRLPFDAFSRGFHKVCPSRILKLFHAQELMTLVIGNEAYDWNAFEKNTEYKNGYSRDHPTIEMFWKVFHALDLSDKKKFLLFLTGSDRIPVMGMEDIKVIMQPMNVDEDHLPVAHTCFDILDLPPYTSEEVLRIKLLQAIQQTQGFGLA